MEWNLERLLRPNIVELTPYESAREKVLSGVLLDANELAESPPGDECTRLNRYPDPGQGLLRRRLADYLGVSAAEVLAGNGSDEVLEWVFKVFCRPGTDRVAVVEPTYGMYRVLADIHGVAVQTFRLDDSFDLDEADLLSGVGDDVKVIFVCSPNNPTGNLLGRDRLVRLLQEFEGLLVVDEAYIEFAEAPSMVSCLSEHPNLIVTRTLSKAWGLAGLRLGYAVASRRVIDCFERVKAPYNLGALTQRTACRFLEDTDRLRESVARIRSARAELAGSLQRLTGVEAVMESEANFLLFRCADASGVCRRLFERGVIIRDRSQLMGLEGWLRVSVGTSRENRQFLQALEEVLP